MPFRCAPINQMIPTIKPVAAAKNRDAKCLFGNDAAHPHHTTVKVTRLVFGTSERNSASMLHSASMSHRHSRSCSFIRRPKKSQRTRSTTTRRAFAQPFSHTAEAGARNRCLRTAELSITLTCVSQAMNDRTSCIAPKSCGQPVWQIGWKHQLAVFAERNGCVCYPLQGACICIQDICRFHS